MELSFLPPLWMELFFPCCTIPLPWLSLEPFETMTSTPCRFSEALLQLLSRLQVSHLSEFPHQL